MNFAGPIESIDWPRYERTVFDMLRVAIDDYNERFKATGGEKVSQISIWTDPRGLTSAVNFETLKSANRHKVRCIEQSRLRGFEDVIATIESQPYNSSAADFKYTMFKQCVHPELSMLQDSIVDDDTETAALRAIEASLLRVVDRIKETELLSGLYAEDSVWIGVNSPDDWYDDVVQIVRGGDSTVAVAAQ